MLLPNFDIADRRHPDDITPHAVEPKFKVGRAYGRPSRILAALADVLLLFVGLMGLALGAFIGAIQQIGGCARCASLGHKCADCYGDW